MRTPTLSRHSKGTGSNPRTSASSSKSAPENGVCVVEARSLERPFLAGPPVDRNSCRPRAPFYTEPLALPAQTQLSHVRVCRMRRPANSGRRWLEFDQVWGLPVASSGPLASPPRGASRFCLEGTLRASRGPMVMLIVVVSIEARKGPTMRDQPPGPPEGPEEECRHHSHSHRHWHRYGGVCVGVGIGMGIHIVATSH